MEKMFWILKEIKTYGKVQNDLDLGTGGPSIQVVTVLIADARNSGGHHTMDISGNPTGGQQFSMSMKGDSSGYNGFASRHGDGRTELSDVQLTVQDKLHFESCHGCWRHLW